MVFLTNLSETLRFYVMEFPFTKGGYILRCIMMIYIFFTFYISYVRYVNNIVMKTSLRNRIIVSNIDIVMATVFRGHYKDYIDDDYINMRKTSIMYLKKNTEVWSPKFTNQITKEIFKNNVIKLLRFLSTDMNFISIEKSFDKEFSRLKDTSIYLNLDDVTTLEYVLEKIVSNVYKNEWDKRSAYAKIIVDDALLLLYYLRYGYEKDLNLICITVNKLVSTTNKIKDSNY